MGQTWPGKPYEDDETFSISEWMWYWRLTHSILGAQVAKDGVSLWDVHFTVIVVRQLENVNEKIFFFCIVSVYGGICDMSTM